ncbi:MAG: hypothetical protein BM556_06715 [Bacteriovorax sp. MedPE-SWde]|nr:MAG: hypothetical protein BM556_06715 [Bacteriovorax sp. MedPE-SWde]
MNKVTQKSILDFWFKELTPQQWWAKDPKLDTDIKRQFQKIHEDAKNCKLSHWRESPKGSLAEIIILDQFSRNIFRDTPQSFSCDPLALGLAQVAIEKGFDKQLSLQERAFLYLPYMHSESLQIHNEAISLFSAKGLESNLEFEMKHHTIIEKFGRYPHRNKILGRESTLEEEEFLKGPNSSF